MSDPVSVRKAEVTIHTLRVGTKQVTKQVWNQIPLMDQEFFLQNPDGKVDDLGWVADTNSLRRDSYYILATYGGTPWRVFIHGEGAEGSAVKTIYDLLKEIRYSEPNFPQLFIGA